MNFLLSFAKTVNKETVSVGEIATVGAIGFAVVFLGIAILVGVLWLVGYSMKTIDAKKSAKVKELPTHETAVAVDTAEDVTDEELIAVITAAVAAVYVKENARPEFTVKKIKRI